MNRSLRLAISRRRLMASAMEQPTISTPLTSSPQRMFFS
jgi:hypothetical protein